MKESDDLKLRKVKITNTSLFVGRCLLSFGVSVFYGFFIAIGASQLLNLSERAALFIGIPICIAATPVLYHVLSVQKNFADISMINRKSRSLAARLARGFCDGTLSNDELMDNWPRRSHDLALEEIYKRLWLSFDDLRSHKAVGKKALNQEWRNIYARCIAFLESDEEYLWPKNKAFPIAGLGYPLIVISLGMLLPLDLWLRHKNKNAFHAFNAAGEIDLWPFLNQDQFDRVVRPQPN